MALNPNHRPKLEEILAHPWMQGEYASDAEIQIEFKRRKDIVDEEAKNERNEKREQRKNEALVLPLVHRQLMAPLLGL